MSPIHFGKKKKKETAHSAVNDLYNEESLIVSDPVPTETQIYLISL